MCTHLRHQSDVSVFVVCVYTLVPEILFLNNEFVDNRGPPFHFFLIYEIYETRHTTLHACDTPAPLFSPTVHLLRADAHRAGLDGGVRLVSGHRLPPDEAGRRALDQLRPARHAGLAAAVPAERQGAQLHVQADHAAVPVQHLPTR